MAKLPGFAEARSQSQGDQRTSGHGAHNRRPRPDREAQAQPASEQGNGCRNSAVMRAALLDGVHRVHASGANHEQ